RYAKGHTVTAATIEAPTEDDKARLYAGNFEQLLNGYYKFDLYATATASEGQYKIRFYDHTNAKLWQTMRALPYDLTVYVKDIVVVTISFLDSATPGLAIKIPQYPNNITISSPEWWNGVRNNSSAYVKNTGTKQIKVKLCGPANYSCNVSATGGWGGINNKSITFDSQGVYTSDSFTISSIVPTVVCTNNVGWQWKVTKDGSTRNINQTSHKIYIVYADNSNCTTRYEQLYEFGCGWANNMSQESQVYDAIWGNMASLNATSSFYYNPDKTIPDNEGFETRDVLIKKNARCGGWMEFFTALLGVQGITVNKVAVIPATPPYIALGVYETIKGQGDVVPDQNRFANHAMSRYNNEYYDPSYGTGPYDHMLEWENASIEEYKRNDGGWVPDTKNISEVLYAIVQ
ncbi:MAG: hypothetical protein PHT33_08020, partial [bacterium]|nr:hypothetical protein [bacterium]